jgi:hypothetical protein
VIKLIKYFKPEAWVAQSVQLLGYGLEDRGSVSGRDKNVVPSSPC